MKRSADLSVVAVGRSPLSPRFALCFVLSLALLLSGCLLDHPLQSYYGTVKPPADQEFRWSDGGLPKIFDPSMAAAPPDTDAVRALYEGLTDYDPQTLRSVPAVAERWEPSIDYRTWTFYLRKDARWSNGDPVTSQDFVRSWKRAVDPQRHAPHAKLLANIAGVQDLIRPAGPTPTASPAATPVTITPPSTPIQPAPTPAATTPGEKPEVASTTPVVSPFGAEAVSEFVLKVRLDQPDADFAALVAHPAFRPSHEIDSSIVKNGNAETLITNGAFRIAKIEADNILLESAKGYWDAGSVGLKRVRFVDSLNAEAALASYRTGDLDAVTNAGFEPLALKLLSPYQDFRRYTFGSLNFYRFNTARAPFCDKRVREALAIAFDRDRLTEDETKGVSEPANSFLPVQMSGNTVRTEGEITRLKYDVERARQLLADAGYPNGQGFPTVRLLINRNEQQRQVAQAVVAMWRNSLGIEAEIITKNWDEYESAITAGDFDIVRRGVVMQTTDESTNMLALMDTDIAPQTAADDSVTVAVNPTSSPAENASVPTPAPAPPAIRSQAQALSELPAMPLYFASSYSLVKPYVSGFDTNLLDAPSLKRVRIDTAWQAPK
ncbi:MAG: peptide ABC transporter substrate-binding protein [Pyrinomonadaceae bacterium]